jgi:hypothetical protein
MEKHNQSKMSDFLGSNSSSYNRSNSNKHFKGTKTRQLAVIYSMRLNPDNVNILKPPLEALNAKSKPNLLCCHEKNLQANRKPLSGPNNSIFLIQPEVSVWNWPKILLTPEPQFFVNKNHFFHSFPQKKKSKKPKRHN